MPTDKEEGHYNRLIEAKVSELHGKKGLYSDSFYTAEEFWNIYDKKAYDALKQKYDPQAQAEESVREMREKKIGQEVARTVSFGATRYHKGHPCICKDAPCDFMLIGRIKPGFVLGILPRIRVVKKIARRHLFGFFFSAIVVAVPYNYGVYN